MVGIHKNQLNSAKSIFRKKSPAETYFSSPRASFFFLILGFPFRGLLLPNRLILGFPSGGFSRRVAAQRQLRRLAVNAVAVMKKSLLFFFV